MAAGLMPAIMLSLAFPWARGCIFKNMINKHYQKGKYAIIYPSKAFTTTLLGWGMIDYKVFILSHINILADNNYNRRSTSIQESTSMP